MKTKKLSEMRITQFLVSLALALLLILIIIPNTIATPIPMGIDGRVFRMDATTQVPKGIPMKIENLQTNEIIEFETGRGTSGRYSVALPWPKGTQISVTAYNPVNSASRTTILTGVIHKFDLVLNMSLPQLSPNITSQPKLSGTQHQMYIYQVVAFDWNEDLIEYSLEEHPKGMTIDNESGIITWIPNSTQSGNYNVVVRASDGHGFSEQAFTINIEEVNDAPVFVSLPVESAQSDTDYLYQIEIFEPEGDAYFINISEGPKKMVIEGNNLSWKVKNSDVGIHRIDLLAVDSQGNEAHQIFNITVSDKPSPGNSGSSGSSRSSYSARATGTIGLSSKSTTQEINSISKSSEDNVGVKKEYSVKGTNNFDFTNAHVDIENVALRNNFNELTLTLKEPERIYGEFANLNRFVFRYIDISSSAKTQDKFDGQILFTVDKKWLSDRAIKPEEIVLMQFLQNPETNEGTWAELETKLLNAGTNEDLLKYGAEFSELSLFAIAHNFDSVPKIPSHKVVDIKQSFIVYGNLLKNDKYFKNSFNRELIIRNENTSQEEKVEYFILPSGYKGYQGQLQGEFGQTIKIIDSKSSRVYAEFVLENNRLPYNLEIGNGGLNSLTGFVSFDSAILESDSIWYFIILALIIIFGFYSVKIKKIIDLRKNKE